MNKIYNLWVQQHKVPFRSFINSEREVIEERGQWAVHSTVTLNGHPALLTTLSDNLALILETGPDPYYIQYIIQISPPPPREPASQQTQKCETWMLEAITQSFEAW